MCGIVGIANHAESSRMTYLGLYALQHRGQESTGISSADGVAVHTHREMGYVADVFTEDSLRRLTGNSSIGHTRYSTSGGSNQNNAQPIVVKCAHGTLALCHNGNLVNAHLLRKELESQGAIFQSTSDSEVILHLVARSSAKTLEEALAETLRRVQGAYSLLILTEDRLLAIRDPWGFRPLCMGRLNGTWAFASETCAFDLLSAEYVRDVEPGEIVSVRNGQMESHKVLPPQRLSKCIFEHVYFSRPDSVVFGRTVQTSRDLMGRCLARESGVSADVVVPIPDSGVAAAIGYSQESGVPFAFGLIRNHYVGRTFIEPTNNIRHFGVKVKLNPIRDLLRGKRVVLIDDSIVRGTTSRKIVKMVRAAGASEVHMRISCPPTMWPCYYGIDTPTRRELIAASHTVEEIGKYIEADTLAYLSLDGLLGSVGASAKDSGFCTACYTGNYVLSFPDGAPEGDADRQLGLWETLNV